MDIKKCCLKISPSGAILLGSVIIALAILIAGGIISLPSKAIKTGTGATGTTPTPSIVQPTPASQIKPPSVSDHFLHGELSSNPEVVIVEYSDLECPYCKKFHESAKQVLDSYQQPEHTKIAWVLRHFPLDQLHSKARKEAEATECAWDQRTVPGFMNMVDKIYEVTPSNNGLNLDNLPKMAAEIGLDQAKFKECLDSGKNANKIEQAVQDALKAGIQGTPTVFLYQRKTGQFTPVPRAVFYEDLKSAIDSILK